jgi:hypothetical protein
MVKMQVLGQIKHKNGSILTRRYGNIFDFVLYYNNNFYSQYIEIKPKWYKRFFKEPFTKEEINKCAKLLTDMACEIVDDFRSKKLAS